MISARNTGLQAFLLAGFLCLFSCSDQDRENLARAQKAFDRLQIGMSHKDACWFAGVTCREDQQEYTYATDIGQSFSKKEYTLMLSIREGKLASVEIIKPKFKGSVRQGSQGEVVARKAI